MSNHSSQASSAAMVDSRPSLDSPLSPSREDSSSVLRRKPVSSESGSSPNISQPRPTRLGDFFTEPRTQYSDLDIQDISLLLKDSQKVTWSQVPRLYTILRTIGQLNVLDTIVEQGISDYWFPFDTRSVPTALTASVRNQFLDSQSLVLTKVVDLEKSSLKHHAHFGSNDVVPFEPREKLGSGGFGTVDKVISTFSRREFARKRFPRKKGGSRSEIQNFRTELQVLKKIQHQHCVELIASYTDAKYFGIIMSPVATCNLNKFYGQAAANSDNQDILRNFFGCLASAMYYLHDKRIRHRDIKPENILVKGREVYLTDFGISLDWENLSRSTTTDDSGRTPMYCAPEVITPNQKRNSSSDIWSLGCVFLEMCTVLKGQTIDAMRSHFRQRSGTMKFHQNIDAIQEWSNALRLCAPEVDNMALDWIVQMVRFDSESRISAQVLHKTITSIKPIPGTERRAFCGECCAMEADSESSVGSASDGELWGENFDEEVTSPPVTDNIVKAALPRSSVDQEASLVDSNPGEDNSSLSTSNSQTVHADASPLPLRPGPIPDSSARSQELWDPFAERELSASPQPTAAEPLRLKELVPASFMPKERSATAPSGHIPTASSGSDTELLDGFKPMAFTSPTDRQHPPGMPARQYSDPVGAGGLPPTYAPDAPDAEQPSDPVDKKAAVLPQVPSESLQRRKTADEMFSLEHETEEVGPNEVQTREPWPHVDLLQRLPRLNPIDWTKPSRFLFSVQEDKDFLQFLHKNAPQAYSLIQNAQISDVSRLVRLLISNGLDPNSDMYKDNQGFTPIYRVLMWKSEEFEPLFGFMIGVGAKINCEAVHLDQNTMDGAASRPLICQAAIQGSTWALVALKAADPELKIWGWRDAAVLASSVNRFEAVQFLIGYLGVDPGYRRASGATPVHAAAIAGHARVVNFLLESYLSNINIENWWAGTTPLYDACRAGRTDVVKLLLAHGAAPHKDSLSEGYAFQYTPLHIAGMNGHAEIVKLIIDASQSPRANATMLDHFGKALYCTCIDGNLDGHLEVAKLLIEGGADPNWSRGFWTGNWSCLHMAAASGNKELVRLLLDSGATVATRTVPLFSGGRPTGNTPIKLAEKGGHMEIVTMLMVAKAEDRAKKMGKKSSS